MLWKINNFLKMHFPSMKVILKNDWGNHFCIDSERGRIIYDLMHRVLQRCERFSFSFFFFSFFLWDQEQYALPFCKKTWEKRLICDRALAEDLAILIYIMNALCFGFGVGRLSKWISFYFFIGKKTLLAVKFQFSKGSKHSISGFSHIEINKTLWIT